MMDPIVIGKATEADSADLWRWRNDEQTRAMSLSHDSVGWEAHNAWFNRSLESRLRHVYVGRLGDLKIGMCRFDLNAQANEAEVSINLNPDAREMRLSAPLLAAAIETFWHEVRADLTATVKRQNLASIKCFTRCGFALTREDSLCNYYRLTSTVE